ncbi:MAG TPA: alpha/beta hydrolase [Parvularculaceae bacterium]|nr:alpha/beta hydrolase [Parvularculaceae bacterium]
MTFIVTHPLDRHDAAVVKSMREISRPGKGTLRSIEARDAFDARIEKTLPRGDVEFETGAVGGVSGVWVLPERQINPEAAILHLHSGWFQFGSAKPFRHFVGHIAARVGAKAFIPEYRLSPENPFPAAIEDALASYRGLCESGVRRIGVIGDSAGGNLALGLASRVREEPIADALVGVAALSPVTDLSLSGESYVTRADIEPYSTREQVAELMRSYLGGADPKHPLASPLFGPLSGLPPIRIHVGDDEILLDDSRRYVERAVAAGVDARLDIWLGMIHGFARYVGDLNAASLALDDIGAFLAQQLRAPQRQ